MSIETLSAFYYSQGINLENRYLDFSEGGPEISASLAIGNYSPTEILAVVANALNEAGGQVYTVTLNRVTRRVTIAAPGNFTLKLTSGTHAALSYFSFLGFTGADLSGSNSYTGNADFGTYYRPQFVLQSYTPFDHIEDSVSSSVNESAQGIIETISFGTRNFMECDLKFITNRDMGLDNPIETNAQGVDQCVAFLKFLRTKSNLEFIPDRDLPNTYSKILLESSPFNEDGVGFKLDEMLDMGLAGFYRTGILKFRKVL